MGRGLKARNVALRQYQHGHFGGPGALRRGWEASAELYDRVEAWLESGRKALTTREGRGLEVGEAGNGSGRSFASGRALKAGAERYRVGGRSRVAGTPFCDGACG